MAHRAGGNNVELRIANCELRILKKEENRDSLVGAAISRDRIDLDNTMDLNRNQRLLLHDVYQ